VRVFFDPTRRQLSRVEIGIAVVVIGIVVWLFLERVFALMVEAERTALTLRLNQLQSALMVNAARCLIRGDAQGLAALAHGNPMRLLGASARDYLGELESPDPAVVDGGYWYFDAGEGSLVYRVKNEAYFETSLEGAVRARFQVVFDFQDADGNGRYDPGKDRWQGIRIQAMEPYRWLSPWAGAGRTRVSQVSSAQADGMDTVGPPVFSADPGRL
jgi:hypothetical protein